MRLSNSINYLGTIGTFVVALSSPCCFPLLAYFGSVLGLTKLQLFGGWGMWIFQLMLAFSVFGIRMSYKYHRSYYPLVLALLSAGLAVYAYHFDTMGYKTNILYIAMGILLVATIWNYVLHKKYDTCKTCTIYQGKIVETKSTLTCPQCEHQEDEIMPTDKCEYFYECQKCHTRLKASPGDCCVYCSYGSVPCPPKQGEN